MSQGERRRLTAAYTARGLSGLRGLGDGLKTCRVTCARVRPVELANCCALRAPPAAVFSVAIVYHQDRMKAILGC